MDHKGAALILASKVKEAFSKEIDAINPRLFVSGLMKDAWEESLVDKAFKITPTTDDWRQVLVNLTDLLDGNLWSQVYLNSPYWTMPRYDEAKITKDLNDLMTQWAGHDTNPLVKGAKLVPESPEMCATDLGWNKAISLSKAANSLAKASGITGYKLYPMGSTPALSDSTGISMLNGKFCDPYIVNPPLSQPIEITYLETLPPMTCLVSSGTDGTQAHVPGYEYKFTSKSGDYDTLTRMLTLREFMRSTFKALDGRCLLIPRWGGVTTIKL